MQSGAIVLCGGHSRRMGRNKADLAFGSETMLARVVRLVGEAVDEVCVVAREGQTVAGDFRLARDPAEGLGPLAGLVAGLEALDCDRTFLCACDAPLVRPAYVSRLLELSHHAEVTVPVIDGHYMVTSAVYAPSVLPVARELIRADRRRPRFLVDACSTRVVTPDDLRDVDPALDSLRDCDTPEAYRDALVRAGLDPAPAAGPTS